MKQHSERALSSLSILILAVVVTFFLLAGSSRDTSAVPSLAPAPVEISDCSQLQAMLNNLSGHYILVNDIDCSGTPTWNRGLGFAPVGISGTPFNGILEGRGHTITGLFINRNTIWNVGLFGYTGWDAEIIGVHLEGVNIGGEQQVGALAGANQGTVTHCTSAGNVAAAMGTTGGLVGYNIGEISRSYSSATVSGVGITSAGGLVGENRGLVTQSWASGNVSGEDRVGGLVGGNISGTVSQCYATGIVTGGNGYTGGLVGSNQYDNALIIDSYATGTVNGGTGAYASAGGLLGVNGGTGWGTEAVENSYSVGPVSGDDAGGLVGTNANSTSNIVSSYWDYQVSGVVTSDGGESRTTAQMMQQITFSGWDFSGVWAIDEGRIYPWHGWQPYTATDLITCQASGNQNFYWSSTDWGVVRECSLTVPTSGQVFISADASLAYGYYEAQFRIGIDNPTGDYNMDRWVSVYGGDPGGSINSLALSTVQTLGPGTHTIYLVVSRFNGSESVLVWDSTLSAIFFPTPESDLMSCGDYGNATWQNNTTSFSIMRQCSLDLPAHGWVYLSADGTADLADNEYEALFRLGVDSTNGDDRIDRWLNVYDDPAGDTDTTLTLSGLLPVSAGHHTFYLLGQRYAGAGTVNVYDSTLNVLYFPAPSLTAASCGVVGNQVWDTYSDLFSVVRQCTLYLPSDSWVFISANAGLHWSIANSTAHFQIGIDNPSLGDANMDRWVDLYSDTGDGNDDGMALTHLRYLGEGTHTFYLLGRRSSGSGTIQVFDSTLTVLALGPAKVYFPAIMR